MGGESGKGEADWGKHYRNICMEENNMKPTKNGEGLECKAMLRKSHLSVANLIKVNMHVVNTTINSLCASNIC